MKRIKVIENYYSKLLCAFLNTPALTLCNYVLLGCYKDRYETLLKETTHFFRYHTNKWYFFEYLWKLIRKGE